MEQIFELLERNIKDCPNYCVERENISIEEDRLHLLEVNGTCPLCGNSLLKNSGKKTKLYEIAHIYPNKPTEQEKCVLNDVKVLGDNSESFQNKIALCFNCHKNYDFHKNKEEYNKLIEKKKKLYAAEKIKNELSNLDLFPQIEKLLDKISTGNIFSNETIELNMTPLEIQHKFQKSEFLLENKIRDYVIRYFVSIREYLKNLAETNQFNFERFAITIKLAYITIQSSAKTKDEIFDSLINWLISKTQATNRIVCEIIISYFVQNCEVFNEVTK